MSDRRDYAAQPEMERKYCFTEQEFLILAGSLDIRQMYGFKPEGPVQTDEREVYQQLFKMTKKGFLEASEDGYLVIPEIRDMFHSIKAADRVITVRAVDERFPEKCIYPGEKTVMMESGGLKGKYYKCSYGTMDKIWEQLCESGILLAQNVADDMLYNASPVHSLLPEDVRLMDLAGKSGAADGTNEWEKMKECGIRTILEQRDITGAQPGKRLFLVERPVYDEIFVADEKGMRFFHYSRQLFMELLSEWVKGGDGE